MMNLVSGSLNAIRNTLMGKSAPGPDFEATAQVDPNFPPTVFVGKRPQAAAPVDSRAAKDSRPVRESKPAKQKFDLPPSPMDSVSADPLASTWMMDLTER